MILSSGVICGFTLRLNTAGLKATFVARWMCEEGISYLFDEGLWLIRRDNARAGNHFTPIVSFKAESSTLSKSLELTERTVTAPRCAGHGQIDVGVCGYWCA